MDSSSLKRITVTLLLTLLFASGDSIQAQQSGRPKNPLTINTDLVVIDVQVTDQNNHSVFDLFDKEDFIVFEDNVKQEIAQISRDE